MNKKMQNKKNYLTPKVSVVKFMVESGFAGSGDRIITVQGVDIPSGRNEPAYETNSSYSGAFGTSGTGESHF